MATGRLAKTLSDLAIRILPHTVHLLSISGLIVLLRVRACTCACMHVCVRLNEQPVSGPFEPPGSKGAAAQRGCGSAGLRAGGVVLIAFLAPRFSGICWLL